MHKIFASEESLITHRPAPLKVLPRNFAPTVLAGCNFVIIASLSRVDQRLICGGLELLEPGLEMPADNLGFARVARLPEIDLARLALGVELGDQIVGHFAHVAAALGRRRRRWREHFGGMAPRPPRPPP